ncbi:MAG TPA: hypothetical protein VJ827_05210 [Rubrobacter sp.]|nr:hypothetical protein [Rubrobacter sp.]
MIGQQQVEEETRPTGSNESDEDTRPAGSNQSEGDSNEAKRLGSYGAALKLTSPWLPIMAVVMTALTYLLPEGLVNRAIEFIGPSINEGVFASFVGLILAFTFWALISIPARRRATAKESSPPNYHQITEALDTLKYKIDSVCPKKDLTITVDNGLDKLSKREAYAEVKGEIKEIDKRLQDGDTTWVTGAGYIELWHRIHRAQEAMIKLEPLSEVAEGPMRDDERLRDANIANRERLLDRLRSAVAVFEAPGANGFLRYLPECKEYSDIRKLGTLNGDAGKTDADAGTLDATAKKQLRLEAIKKAKHAEETKKQLRPEAIAILVETRYEINRFRDNSWEGIVNARNHLLDTSMNLGLMTYALLVFALIMTPEPGTILWAAIYFLIGAITALFARARIEWSTASAVDDFGLTRARLVHLPWLAGLAAVGGVLVTAVLGPQLVPSSVSETAPAVVDVFNGDNTSLLLVAAIFGLTPDLIIRRLEQQTEKYKADLESTQSTQSTESGVKSESGATTTQSA